MRQRTILDAALGAALLILPAPAGAGAPNPDCAVGGKRAPRHRPVLRHRGRQRHRGQADGLGRGGRHPPGRPVARPRHRFRGAAWEIAIRGGGESLVVTRLAGELTGHCIFIPGNFALRSADRGGFALRARPSGAARRLLRIPVGTAVWERPDRVHEGDWLLVEAALVRTGSLTTVDGWLRQRKPSVAR